MTPENAETCNTCGSWLADTDLHPYKCNECADVDGEICNECFAVGKLCKDCK